MSYTNFNTKDLQLRGAIVCLGSINLLLRQKLTAHSHHLYKMVFSFTKLSCRLQMLRPEVQNSVCLCSFLILLSTVYDDVHGLCPPRQGCRIHVWVGSCGFCYSLRQDRSLVYSYFQSFIFGRSKGLYLWTKISAHGSDQWLNSTL
jgi:hypothetical protein